MPKTVLRLTAHFLEDYENCPLYFHRVVNLQRGELTKAANLARGIAIHELLASYYTGKRDGVDFDVNVTKAVEDFQISALDINGLIVEDIDRCIAVFHEYTSWYQDRDNFEIVAVEETLSKVLYEDDDIVILYEGTQDMVIRQQGVIIPFDHKSEAYRFPVSLLSNQFMGYSVLTDEPRIIRNAVGFQEKKPVEEKFYRTMYTYSQLQLEWWKRETIKKGLRIIKSYRDNDWPAHFSACDSMHRKGCPYKPVCTEDVRLWPEILERDYVFQPLYDRNKIRKEKVVENVQ